jgi:hypothetical protein
MQTTRCTAEENTVHREGVNIRFFKGDGVVKNVPEDKAAVFEVHDAINLTQPAFSLHLHCRFCWKTHLKAMKKAILP